MSAYRSWGHYPEAEPRSVQPLNWRHDPPELSGSAGSYLTYGLGRSYGDCCLNDDGHLLDAGPLSKFIHFDPEAGILRAEAGISLIDILNLSVPKGWFLPVTPGTKFVSLGGAIANDVHGKNHHRAGTFGRHVLRFALLRSDGQELLCSPRENPEYYAATIGGLGLTGLILWAEIQLKAIPGPKIRLRPQLFSNLSEFLQLSKNADETDDYTAGWIDGMSRGKRLGRGVFLSGDHARGSGEWKDLSPSPLRLPFDLPSFALNPLTVRSFNEAYYRFNGIKARQGEALAGYGAFFYPLDVVHNWNRAYGKRGFLQYQCVVPFSSGLAVIEEILDRLAHARCAYFVVGKVFGDMPSPGMLSFPREGVTLAVDIPNRGPEIFTLLDNLDALVIEAGGAIYPAKDARMSPETFQASCPDWRAFLDYKDPAFSSSLWRRVTAGQSFEHPPISKSREPEQEKAATTVPERSSISL